MMNFIANNWKWLMVLKVIEVIFCFGCLFNIIDENYVEKERDTEKVENDEQD